MARYFFHIHDGVDHPDPEGAQLRTLGEVREHAALLAAQVLIENADAIWRFQNWGISVTDEAGREILSLKLIAGHAQAALS